MDAQSHQLPNCGSRIFDLTGDLILVVDSKGILLEVSPSSAPILGYAPTDMVGHVASDFLYGPDLEATREEMRKARNAPGDASRFECRYVHQDGSIVSLVWSGVWDAEDSKHYFVGRNLHGAMLGTMERIECALSQIETRLGQATSGLAEDSGARLPFFYPSGHGFRSALIIESGLAVNSAWIAWVLFHPPSNYLTSPAALALMAYVIGNERVWAALALMSALIKVTGIAAALSSFLSIRRNAVPVRIIGMGMSGALWCLMGTSVLYGNPDSLFAMMGLTVGLYAWWHALSLTR